jgi:protein-tyrosine phosphatase
VLPELYWIREIAPLRLTQMPRPRAGDWLSDEIAGWQRAGISTVVSMLEHHEVRELQLDDEPLFCKYYGIDFLSLPTPDAGTPHSLHDTSTLVDELVSRLRHDQGVAIHCRAGIGRSGLLSACVLLRLGVPLADVFPILSRTRKIPIPETPVQVAWVQRFAANAAGQALQAPES